MNTIRTVLHQKFTRLIDPSKNPLLDNNINSNDNNIDVFNHLSEKSGFLTKADKNEAVDLINKAKNDPSSYKLVALLAEFRHHLVDKNPNLQDTDSISIDDTNGSRLLNEISKVCTELKMPFHKIIILTLNRHAKNNPLFGPNVIPTRLKILIEAFPGNKLGSKLSISQTTKDWLQAHGINIKIRQPVTNKNLNLIKQAVEIKTTTEQLHSLLNINIYNKANTNISEYIQFSADILCNDENIDRNETCFHAQIMGTDATGTSNRWILLRVTLRELAKQIQSTKYKGYLTDELINNTRANLTQDQIVNLHILTQKFKIIKKHLEALNDEANPNFQQQAGIDKYTEIICTIDALISKFEKRTSNHGEFLCLIN